MVGQDNDCHNVNVPFMNSAAVSTEGPSLTSFGLGFSTEKELRSAHCSPIRLPETLVAPISQKAPTVPTCGFGGCPQVGSLHEKVFVVSSFPTFPKSQHSKGKGHVSIKNWKRQARGAGACPPISNSIRFLFGKR